MIDEDAMGILLELTFDHYDVSYAHSGQVSIKCPVHDDRQASATANMGRGLWHCLACGQGGNAIQLIQTLENLEFKDALEFAKGLLDRSGREIPRGSDWVPRRSVPKRKRNRSSGSGYRPSWLD